MLLSEADEIKLGRETDIQIDKEYGIYEDPKLTAYLNGFCQQIARLSHRPQLTYHFKIINASVVNAFAVPGGYIYFSRGILATLNNEAELASVMGHEIGHIAARHSARQYSRAQLAQVGLGIGTIFLDSSILSGLAQLGTGMLLLRFSRDNEREADDLAVEYASKAGYDASQLASFFENLERMNPGTDRSGLPGWFSTHPSPENRVKMIRLRAQEWRDKLKRTDFSIHRDSYLRTIDGLVFGDDPRQGYVDEHIFYHPDLRFQLPVPTKWKLTNKPSYVQMVSEKQDAVLLLSVSKGSSSREAARNFFSRTGISVIRSEAIQVNGLSAQRIVSEMRSQREIYRLFSLFIEKGENVFILHGLTPLNQFQGYVSLFENSMLQFREITELKKIQVKPDRLRIRSTSITDTLESALRSFGVEEKRLKEMALLNGKDLNQMIPANTLVKVIERGR